MTSETVEIPVELAEAIVDLGKRLLPFIAAGPGEPGTIRETFVNVPGQGPWTKKNVVDFKEAMRRLPGAKAVLDFAANHRDQEVKFTDIIEETEMEPRQVAAELGAMSKVARKAFGEKMWPISAWQASDGVMRYKMLAVIADWWSQA